MKSLEIERAVTEPRAQRDRSEASPGHHIRINGHKPPPGAPFDDGIERTSTWWIAAAYNITAIVGLGVLALPSAMVFLSWYGVAVMALACFITYFTLKQLVELHEFEPSERYMTYQSLGQRAFGKSRGLKIVLPLQIIVELSLDILFTVAAGEAMIRILEVIACHYGHHQVQLYGHLYIWFAAFAAIQIGLSFWLPNFHSIRGIVVVAAIMSVCYTTIAWITLVSVKHPADHDYGPATTLTDNKLVDSAPDPSEHLGLNQFGRIFQAFNAIGVIAFAYAAHNVVLDIQNELPSAPSMPSKIAMMKGVNFTYIVVVLCYFPMGIAVYWVYGNKISHNVLGFMMDKVNPGWVITTNIMLIIHLVGSYQIFAIPIFTLLENGKFKKCPPKLIRSIYIVATMLIAMILPYFSPLLGFFGGLVIAPTTYILPCAIWLCIDAEKKLKNRRRQRYINWVLIILGTLIMLLAVMGGILALIKQMSIQKFYRLFRDNWKNSGFYPPCPKK